MYEEIVIHDLLQWHPGWTRQNLERRDWPDDHRSTAEIHASCLRGRAVTRTEVLPWIRAAYAQIWTLEEHVLGLGGSMSDYRFERMRNYEIEHLLSLLFGDDWVIAEPCPFNGEFCRWGGPTYPGIGFPHAKRTP